MTLKQNVYAVLIAIIVGGVSLFALQNFQDVNVSIPFVGTIHTKLFVVIVFSFLAGFLTAGFLSLILKLFSLPSNLKKRREKSGEVGPVPKTVKDSKEESPNQGAVPKGTDKN